MFKPVPSLNVLWGSTGSGKTRLVEHFIQTNIRFFRWGTVFTGSDGSDDYDFLPPKHVKRAITEVALLSFMKHAWYGRKLDKANGIPEAKRRVVFLVLDDQTGSGINWKSDVCQELITQRRHLGICILVMTHSGTTLPPIWRDLIDMAALFDQRAEPGYRKVHELFGDDYSSWKELRDALKRASPSPGRCLSYDRHCGMGNKQCTPYVVPNPKTWVPIAINF